MAGTESTKPRPRFRPPVGPRLKKLLYVLFALVALIGVNSVYLVTIRAAGAATGRTYENYFFQWMFLLHLVLGFALVLPVVLFGILHMRNTFRRPNKRAIAMGYSLFATSLILLISGIVLTRVEIPRVGLINLPNPTSRTIVYWAHVITPLIAVWLYILHRLAGRRIKWRVGVAWAGVASAFAVVMLVLQAADPRAWNVVGPESGEAYFFPSLARTSTGNFIPAKALMMDQYCIRCHEDTHRDWSHSAHRFSSFNNPAYLFSVTETRKVALERDGNVQASRFCAGCHDTVPFFSGAFDDPEFDMEKHPTAQAGVTCTSCHAITNINSPRGNSDYTIEEPLHYPFAYSDNGFLKWVNEQLVKANPTFHKKTFLKPLHSTPEFCGSCHKVHLPEELNHYKWLRGQNHYDPFLLSGVSGHGVTSFYYPPVAETNCNGCHMPLAESTQFAAKFFDDSGKLKIHDHQFPSANTAIPHLLGMPDWVNEKHRDFLDGVMRVDIFGVRDGADIDAPLTAPIRPETPILRPGGDYLIETVIRTVKMGHIFTQGTADSNEIWMDVTVRDADRVIGRSGGMDPDDNDVDPWSHFVNAYVLDREGNRIDRRNAQDIFIPLYSNQIPPGAGSVVHYRLAIPEDVTGPITIDVALKYRKFDTTYMQYVYGPEYVNDLPITTLATDSVTFPINESQLVENPDSPIVPWQRWNDFGIGLLLKGDAGSSKGELKWAAQAFAEVEKLGRPDGPLNIARVLYKEGRVDEAVTALQRAKDHDPPAPAWTLAWFIGLVNMENGNLDEAIENFTAIIDMDTPETRERKFDFSLDYRVLNQLGLALFERAKQERGDANRAERDRLLNLAVARFDQALVLDPENLTAHYNLALVHAMLGDDKLASRHRDLHAKYKPDDNAADIAIAHARATVPSADHSAESVVVYDLQRAGAFGLSEPPGIARAPVGPQPETKDQE
jgi:tetratricopeptide (TPR) repeat protein